MIPPSAALAKLDGQLGSPVGQPVAGVEKSCCCVHPLAVHLITVLQPLKGSSPYSQEKEDGCRHGVPGLGATDGQLGGTKLQHEEVQPGGEGPASRRPAASSIPREPTGPVSICARHPTTSTTAPNACTHLTRAQFQTLTS